MLGFESAHQVKIQKALQSSLSYLNSNEALSSLERDPYWPKWNTPWWHMLLLYEMGWVHLIPEVVVHKMVEVLKTYYLKFFPIKEEEIPKGTDQYRKIPCHCALGSMYQVLFFYGVNVDVELPWIRPWFLKYQLSDGGLNCDEKAYLKLFPKSSIVSTLPCLEAVLYSRSRDLNFKSLSTTPGSLADSLTIDEINFLNRGADYLVRHQLFRKQTTGEIIDSQWMEIKFPRFYEYDFLRGYYFLIRWNEISEYPIPKNLTDVVTSLVSQQWSDQGILLKRYHQIDDRSYQPSEDTSDKNWIWGKSSEFDLMKAVSFEGCPCPILTQQWEAIQKRQLLV